MGSSVPYVIIRTDAFDRIVLTVVWRVISRANFNSRFLWKPD